MRGSAEEVGVEVFSMPKSHGMAGWRVGFVVGNADIVEQSRRIAASSKLCYPRLGRDGRR
jgi:aspartate/methionine/tyrosine aminotransferase